MKIYLQADDFGLTKKITDDILECIDAGTINSVSVMANGYSFEYAMAELKKRGNISISLHLNVDQSKSVARKDLIPLLTNDQGFITSSFEKLFFSYYTSGRRYRSQIKEQVKTEIKSQIEKILPHLKERDLPLRIDSERSSHMIPFIFDILTEIAEQYQISFIRVISTPNYFYLRDKNDLGAYFGLNILKHVLLNAITVLFGYKAKLMKRKIAYTDLTFSLIHSSVAIDQGLIQKYIELSARYKAQSAQIIFHPFKPSEEEMPLWDIYPTHRRFFNRLEAGQEKEYLLTHRDYFRNIISRFDI